MQEFLISLFSEADLKTVLVMLLIFVVGLLPALLAFIELARLSKAGNDAGFSIENQHYWHSLGIDQVLKALETRLQGLSGKEAGLRFSEFGPNCLPEVKPPGVLVRFISQFHNILIYVLLGTSVVTAILEHWVDTSVILGVVIINAAIGFLQEGKAENALRAIRQMLSPQAMLLRNGRKVTIPAEELVPGDIVLLQSGDKVPADLRLFQCKGLQIQESMLTGESVPVIKMIDTIESATVLGDRFNMAYSGTLVTHGQGAGIVVETGMKTEIGLISTLVSGVEKLTTPLLQQMARFGHWLTLAILLVAVLTFTFGVRIRGYDMTEMFLAVVGLAVAAIPEGLPAIMTITLAIGVQRMARRKAIIRRLPAVETLGSVSVICSDKTGTLTRNEMTVRSIATADKLFQINGTGYNSSGTIESDGVEINVVTSSVLKETLIACILCNDSSLELNDEGNWKVHGDPMEGALLIAALKAGLDLTLEQQQNPQLDLLPFDAEHRFMATLHTDSRDHVFIVLKGAPERVLEMCTRQRCSDGDEPLETSLWNDKIEELAASGQRVLAVAIKRLSGFQDSVRFSDVENSMSLLGLIGLMDPPRKEAIAAVRKCQEAGIQVKMITGDHSSTALSIAKQLHLKNTDQVMVEQDLLSISEEELRQQVCEIDVYARVSPKNKLLLVQVLQDQGLIVAMTGDGVNDAPALKRADVGTAMGYLGTEAAKEAAEMVLTDNNFASIVNAIEEGRTVYDNIRKAILFILPSSGGEALIIIVAVLFGFHQLPLTPVQILWVNMITTVTLALVLAFEPPEKDVMLRPPRASKEPILTPLLVWRIVFVSVILMSGTFGLFLMDMDQGMTIEHARTIAVNTLVMFEIFYLFNSRYILAPVLNWRGVFGNRYILLAISVLMLFQFGFTYLPFMQNLFGTTDIDARVWMRIVLVASSVFFLVELEKAVIRWIGAHRN